MPAPHALVVFHKQLGDLLLLEPAISVLAEREGAPIAILTRSGHAPLIRLFKNAVKAEHPIWTRYQSIWGFDSTHKTFFYTRLCRAKKHHLRLDPDHIPHWYHRLFFRDLRYGFRKENYIARYFWDMTNPGTDLVFSKPSLNPPPRDWLTSLDLPKVYLLANVTAGWPSKCWNIPAWVETLNHLTKTHRLPVIITAGNSDWQIAHADQIHSQLQQSINLAGKTSLREFISLVYNASKMITVDGFASHLAAAWDIPCLTLFSGKTVYNWFYATPTSQAIVATDILGVEGKLKRLPASPVIEKVDSLAIKAS